MNQQMPPPTFQELQRQIEANANTGTPLPTYRCHKEVWALRIGGIVPAPKPTIAELEAILGDDPGRVATPGAILIPDGNRYGPIAVPLEWFMKHKPEAGGYLVFYKDGYRSFSPAKAFEDGYSPV